MWLARLVTIKEVLEFIEVVKFSAERRSRFEYFLATDDGQTIKIYCTALSGGMHKLKLYLQGTPLDKVSKYKYLGVTITSELVGAHPVNLYEV